jgi:hypothetical protein
MRIQGSLVEIFVGLGNIFFVINNLSMLSEWSLLAKVITIWVLSVKSCLVLKETGFCFVLLF